MSDFLHESMIRKMTNELFDENGYPDIKEYTEGQIRDAFNSGYAVGQEEGAKFEVLKALEDVRAEITGNLETIIGKYDSNTKPEDVPSRKIERNNATKSCEKIC